MADPVGADKRQAQDGSNSPQPAPQAPSDRPESKSDAAPVAPDEQPGTDPAPTPALGAETPKPSPSTPETPTTVQPDLQSRLDGLRGWLAALDRTVSIRTQVGVVLLALAIGFGAAALFLAIDARENGASEARVESLREALQVLNLRTARTARQLAALRETVDAADTQASGTGTSLQSLEAQVNRLRAQVQSLQSGKSGTGAAPGGPESESPPAGTKGTDAR